MPDQGRPAPGLAAAVGTHKRPGRPHSRLLPACGRRLERPRRRSRGGRRRPAASEHVTVTKVQKRWPGWRFDLEALPACQPAVLHHDRLFRCRPAQCVPRLEACFSRRRRQHRAARHRSYRAADSPGWPWRSLPWFGLSGLVTWATCGVESHSTTDDPVLIALPDRDGNATCKM